MTRKRLLSFVLFAALSFVGLSWGTQPIALAATPTMCRVLVRADVDPNNCLAGQVNPPTALSSLASLPDSELKSAFIAKMVNFEKSDSEGGQKHLRVGARHIEALIAGDSKMFWQDRLNLSDVKLDIRNVTYAINSGYNPSSNSVVSYSDYGTEQSLVFVVEGNVRFALKLDCGNALNDMTLPSPPVIRGYKIDNTGNPIGSYSTATVTATNAVPSSDIDQPFSFSIRTSKSSKVEAVLVNGYEVIGSTLAQPACPDYNCPIVPTYNPVLGPTVAAYNTNPGALGPNFVSGSSRTITGLLAGFKYDMRWVYQKVTPPEIVTITGKKVDTSGNTGSFSNAVISATKTTGGATLYEANNPFNFKVDAGSYSITANNSIGWEVVGYSTCTPIIQLCIPPLAPTSSGNTASLNLSSYAGKTVTLNWVYDKYCSIHPNDPKCTFCALYPSDPSCKVPPPNDTLACPNTNIPANQTVAVALPDGTPAPSTGPAAATTSPNSQYNQYNSLNKTKVISVQDVSSGGNRLLSMLNLKSESYQQAVVDYSPFVAGYPYDNNQASVTYSYTYTVTPYISASTPSYYTCADGSTPDANHICTSSRTTTSTSSTTSIVNAPTTTTPATHCSNNTVGTWNGTDCGTYSVTSAVYSCTSGTPVYSTYPIITSCNTSYDYAATDHWYCRKPGNVNATWSNGGWCAYTNRVHYWYCYTGTLITGTTNCRVTSSIAPKIVYTTTQVAYPVQTTPGVTTYGSCTSPDTAIAGDPSKCTRITTTTTTTTTYTYTFATAWYNYTKQASYTQVASNTASGLAMTPCFPRGFSVTDVNANSANVSLNNYENPSSITAGGFSAAVTFKYTDRLPTQGLRQQMTVNLAYSNSFSRGCSGNNSTFTITGSVGANSVTLPSSGAGCTVSVPPLMPGDTVCTSYSVSPTGSTMNVAGSILGSNGGIIRSAEKCSGPVVNEPYFKVFGGDVSVGGTFADGLSCGSSVANARIFGWNTANNPIYPGRTNAGAGAQFAISSLGSNSLFNSNQYNLNASPASGALSSPLGMSFGSASCIPDYYSSLPLAANITADISGTTNLNGLNGVYTMSSGSTIKSSNISSGKRVTIYASGNVLIDGNIDFVGSYPTVNDIPSLIIIAKGNIYISNNVSKLTGIYVAQPSSISGAEGYIYDCASGSSPVANGQIYNDCGTQLTVNGSFIANKVFLNRTGNATNNKSSSSLRASSASETNTNSNATEIFNYGPAFWMNLVLPQTTSTGTSNAGYDSIISLPPIL